MVEEGRRDDKQEMEKIKEENRKEFKKFIEYKNYYI